MPFLPPTNSVKALKAFHAGISWKSLYSNLRYMEVSTWIFLPLIVNSKHSKATAGTLANSVIKIHIYNSVLCYNETKLERYTQLHASLLPPRLQVTNYHNISFENNVAPDQCFWDNMPVRHINKHDSFKKYYHQEAKVYLIDNLQLLTSAKINM